MINGYLNKTIFLNEREIKDLNDKKPTPALFLDRDGVILQENNHLSDPRRVKLEKGIRKLTEFITSKNIPIVIITNQSGIYDKSYQWEDYSLVTQKMISLLGFNVRVYAIYANGESRESKNLFWRKPSPKMILEAKNKFNIEINKSILIGDRLSDLEAGFNAQLTNLIHVKTGHGEKERKKIIKKFKSSKKDSYLKGKLNLFLVNTLEDLSLKKIQEIMNI